MKETSAHGDPELDSSKLGQPPDSKNYMDTGVGVTGTIGVRGKTPTHLDI